MEFERIYAYAVLPQKTSAEDERVTPEGGSIDVTADIRGALDSAMKRAKLHQQCSVAFDMGDDRTNDTRDLIRKIMFGNTKTPQSAAEALAVKLASVTDNRSSASLLVIAVAGDDSDSKQITLWAFPSEEAYQFKKKGKGNPKIEYLKNVFSQTPIFAKRLFLREEIRVTIC